MAVQQSFRVEPVETDISEVTRMTKEPPVRDRAGRQEERNADEARPECVPWTGGPTRQGCSGGGAAVVGGAGCGVVVGDGAVGFGAGACWKPSPLLVVVDVAAGETPDDEVE